MGKVEEEEKEKRAGERSRGEGVWAGSKRKEELKEDFHVKAFNQKFSNLGGSLN